MKVAAVLLLALFALPVQEHQTVSRFHLVPAASMDIDPSGIKTEEHRVFLIDESTGNVWEYSPSLVTPQQPDGKVWFKDSGFYRVYIDGLDSASQRPKMAPTEMRLSK